MALTTATVLRRAARTWPRTIRTPGVAADAAAALTATLALSAAGALGGSSVPEIVAFACATAAGLALYAMLAGRAAAFRPLIPVPAQWSAVAPAALVAMAAQGFGLALADPALGSLALPAAAWWLAFLASSLLLRYLSAPTSLERAPVVLVGGGRDLRDCLQRLLLRSENTPFALAGVVDTGDHGLTPGHLSALRKILASAADRPAVLMAGCGLDGEARRALSTLCRNFDVPFGELGLACATSPAGNVLGRRLALHWPAAHALTGSDRLVKRAFDLVGASILVMLLSPLLVALSVLVRRDGGPALYAHRRIGRDGQSFPCFKFRSMVPDADAILEHYLSENAEARAEWEATQKLRHDPRVTPIGAVLRRLSLDELPQLLNVIRGDMSLVGPRPIVTAEIDKYAQAFPDYCAVPPGMTGLWQVSGRSDVDYEERVLLDSWYACHRSFWLDLFILLRTPAAVLLRRGAY